MPKFTLKACRINKHLKLSDVSTQIGVSQKTLLTWESGKVIPNVIKAMELCSIYEVPIESVDFLVQSE